MEGFNEQYDAEAQVYSEQVAHLYHQSRLSLIFNIVNGSILVVVLWKYIAVGVLMTWYAALLIVTFCRAVLSLGYGRSQPGYSAIRWWCNAYMVGAGVAGTVWGFSSVLFFPLVDAGPQLFVVFMLAGMIAGGVSVLSARLSVFVVYAVPALAPLAWMFFAQSDPISQAMGLMTILFLTGMLFAARGTHRTIVTSLQLRFDNRELAIQISKRKQIESTLVQEKERLRITLAALAEGVAITSADAKIEYLNPAAEKLSGWSLDEASGQSIGEVLRCLDEHTRKPMVSAAQTCMESGLPTEKNAILLMRGGQEQLLKSIATPLTDSKGTLCGSVVVLRNVTSERKKSRALAYQASHDWLTQLPNRALFWDRIKQALAKASRTKYIVAVLFMDLDFFKQVNDNLGHAAGDALLIGVADRLRASVREGDTVARLGGDEFVVLLENLSEPQQASNIARQIADNLAAPFNIEGSDLSITASVGVALYPKDSTDAETLLKNADTAMYCSKQQGRNKIQLYSPELDSKYWDSSRETKPG